MVCSRPHLLHKVVRLLLFASSCLLLGVNGAKSPSYTECALFGNMRQIAKVITDKTISQIKRYVLYSRANILMGSSSSPLAVLTSNTPALVSGHCIATVRHQKQGRIHFQFPRSGGQRTFSWSKPDLSISASSGEDSIKNCDLAGPRLDVSLCVELRRVPGGVEVSELLLAQELIFGTELWSDLRWSGCCTVYR